MLIDANKLIGCPVLSLHVGGPIAEVSELIINPDNLKIAAFRLIGPETGGENGDILQVDKIREFSSLGMVVDSIDDFVSQGDVVRLDKILDLNFEMLDKKVESKKGSKIGKVISYTINTSDFRIQQFTVQRPLIKSFLDPELLIGISEVTKVTDDKIIVRDEEDKIRKRALKEDFVPNFVNPFRENRLASESKIAKNAKTTGSKPNPSPADNQTLDEPDS